MNQINIIATDTPVLNIQQLPGYHNGDQHKVSRKHLARYLDEFVFFSQKYIIITELTPSVIQLFFAFFLK